MRMRTVSLIAIATALVCTMQACASTNQTLAWNQYDGTMTTPTSSYDVVISEDSKGDGFSRIVHLRPVNMPSYVGMTGHDYDGDGKWDAIFYCGRPNSMVDSTNSGCNSVRSMSVGWSFEPCAADEGKAKPFTNEAIAFAIAELDSAMNVIHNDRNVRSKWVWDSEADSGMYIFERGK